MLKRVGIVLVALGALLAVAVGGLFLPAGGGSSRRTRSA
jgi:hypothetical protein